MWTHSSIHTSDSNFFLTWHASKKDRPTFSLAGFIYCIFYKSQGQWSRLGSGLTFNFYLCYKLLRDWEKANSTININSNLSCPCPLSDCLLGALTTVEYHSTPFVLPSWNLKQYSSRSQHVSILLKHKKRAALCFKAKFVQYLLLLGIQMLPAFGCGYLKRFNKYKEYKMCVRKCLEMRAAFKYLHLFVSGELTTAAFFFLLILSSLFFYSQGGLVLCKNYVGQHLLATGNAASLGCMRGGGYEIQVNAALNWSPTLKGVSVLFKRKVSLQGQA